MGPRPKLAALAFLSSIATACTLLRDLDYLTRDPIPDGGEDVATMLPDASVAEAASEGGLTPCVGGGIVKPARALAYQAPVFGEVDAAATTCEDIDNVLEQDHKLVGLDQTVDNIGTGRLNGKEIGGCVAVEFPPGQRLTNVQVRAVAVRDACGVSPCTDDPRDGCGTPTGLKMFVFAGPTLDALTLAGSSKDGLTTIELVPVTRSLEIAPEDNGHFVVVCRNGNAAVTRDDVGVDAIWTECR